MEKINHQYRQGDVLLQPVESLPDGAKTVKNSQRIVLAEGEVTGHAHVICANQKQVRQFTKDAQVYLEVNLPVTLEHEEHGPITVDPGIYHVRRQVEQWMDEVRAVAD